MRVSPVDMMHLSFTCKHLQEVLEGEDRAFLRQYLNTHGYLSAIHLYLSEQEAIQYALAKAIDKTTCFYCKTSSTRSLVLDEFGSLICKRCLEAYGDDWECDSYSTRTKLLSDALAKQGIILDRSGRICGEFARGDITYRMAVKHRCEFLPLPFCIC